MKQFKLAGLFMCVFSFVEAFSQTREQVEMADVLRQDGKIYTVVLGVVVIFTAMIILLLRVDRRIFRLEQHVKKKEKPE